MEIELLVSTPNIRHIYYLLTQTCSYVWRCTEWRVKYWKKEPTTYQKIIKTSTAHHKISADNFN